VIGTFERFMGEEQMRHALRHRLRCAGFREHGKDRSGFIVEPGTEPGTFHVLSSDLDDLANAVLVHRMAGWLRSASIEYRVEAEVLEVDKHYVIVNRR